jgi:hypothetical protein
MKVIIAGGRDFDDYHKLEWICDSILAEEDEPIEIVSGTARGADKLGERYVEEKIKKLTGIFEYKLTKFPANWDEYGKSAGYIRNEEMAEYADMLIAFWDWESKGTKHMIDLARKHGLQVIVVAYDGGK